MPHRIQAVTNALGIGFMLVSFGALFLPLLASADCVLGCRSCQGGFEYTCEKCGSETCWILSGGRCNYSGSKCAVPKPDKKANDGIIDVTPIASPPIIPIQVGISL